MTERVLVLARAHVPGGCDFHGIRTTDAEALDELLAGLASDFRTVLVPDDAAPFHPHVTLGRARREPADLRDWSTSTRAGGRTGGGPDRAHAQPHRSRTGAIRSIAAADLGVAAHA